METIIIEISCDKDYQSFYNKYMDNNHIKEAYNNFTFIFEISFPSLDDVDEHLLFEFYLIANKCFQTKFELRCIFNNNTLKEVESTYHFLSAYGFIQQNVENINCNIIYKDNKHQKMQTADLKGVKRLLPVFNVSQESVKFLKQPVTEQMWEKILCSETNQLNTFENIVYRICWRLLFSDIGVGNTELTKLRTEVFKSDNFKELVYDIPILAVVIFAMMDYAFREEAVDIYKKEIKKERNIEKVLLKEADFLNELQYEQKIEHFKIHQAIHSSFNNKSLLESYEDKKIHTYIINELYEAITISEGLIQLFENIVNHAGDNGQGIGLAEIFIRNYNKDSKILNKRYHDYINTVGEEFYRSKYFLEIVVADLSGTNIPDKFESNNSIFFKNNMDELKRRMRKISGNDQILYKVGLKSFFAPEDKEQAFWQSFFSFSDKAVHHYGLQIFDSTITSKRGLFQVYSGKEYYDNMNTEKEIENVRGSRYYILCPANRTNTGDNNIYDSMFGYDYIGNISQTIEIINVHHTKTFIIPTTTKEMEQCIQDICDEFPNINPLGNKLLNIDVRDYENIECLVKGLILYIFKLKEKNSQIKLMIALRYCMPHQIINIVRILSVFYGKQGENIKMENVQIYIRGNEIGEEVLFYGKDLQEVRNNISKSACMRGTMFDNLQTINLILRRINDRGNDDE